MTKQRGRLGAAPYHIRTGLSFVQYEARQRFLIAVAELAPAVNESLYDLFTENKGKLPGQAIERWAQRWHLLHQGRCADWIKAATSIARMIWNTPDVPNLPLISLPLPLGVHPFGQDQTSIRLPGLQWHPLQGTRQPDRTARVETKAEGRKRIMDQLDAELDRIESAAKNLSAEPTPVKAQSKHWIWAIHFQVQGIRVCDIAAESDERGNVEEERNIHARISGILSLVGLDKRRGRPGRRPKLTP